MKKKALLTSLLVTFLSVAMLLTYLVIEKILEKRNVAEKVDTLSAKNLVDLDSLPFSTPRDTKVILIFFNSTCDHCQQEAIDIKENISGFNKGAVVFFSSESLAAIRDFSTRSGLSAHSFVHFAKIDSEKLFDEFGVLSVPHTFIYNKERKLVKEFKGAAAAEAILKYF